MVYVRFKGIPQTDILMRNAMTYITICVWNSRSNENTVCFRLLVVHWSPSRCLSFSALFTMCSPWPTRVLSPHSVEMPAQVTSRSGTVWCCEPVLFSGSPGFLLFQSVKTKYSRVWAVITTQTEIVLSSIILFIQAGKLDPAGLSLRPSEGCCSGRASPL